MVYAYIHSHIYMTEVRQAHVLLAVLANHLGGVWECSHRKMLEFIPTKIGSGGVVSRFQLKKLSI